MHRIGPVDNPIRSPVPAHTGIMLSTSAHTLLCSLFRDLSGDRHILNLSFRHAMSTALDRRGDHFEVEHPVVIERLHMALTGHTPAALILRTFTDRVHETLPDGTIVPVKSVRGWRVGHRTLIPLDEAQMFDAHCTDAASGEPVPPEPGVEYVDAPYVDLSDLEEV